jgi:hypothetical protein
MEWQCEDWIHMTQDRNQNVKTGMKLERSTKVGNFFTDKANISFSRRSLIHGVSYLNSIIHF